MSAFCSVSAEPPLVLVCIDKGSRTLAAVKSAGAFTVNMLHAESQEIALAFASKGDDKFESVEWRVPGNAGGGPVLHAHAAAHLACRTTEEIEAGDHWVIIGRVEGAEILDADRHLLYHHRRFSAVG